MPDQTGHLTVMKIIGIIPARYASTRFPAKALALIHGKTMVRRVYEQAIQSQMLTEVLVATDHELIAEEIRSFGGQVMMTSTHHLNGTERCAEVLSKKPDYEYVINIQGDEPFIHPQQIDTLASMLDGTVEIATLVKPIENLRELDDPMEMKVVMNTRQQALYFSRSCIPYARDCDPQERLHFHTYYKHIGIYAFRTDVLPKITALPPGNLEKTESLEQLRWLENGYTIQLGITDLDSHMIDTPEELERLTHTLCNNS